MQSNIDKQIFCAFNVLLVLLNILGVSVRAFIRILSLSSITCAIAGSAMATPVAAPGPEIGDGVVGAVVAAVALLAFVMLPRVKRMLQSKQN